MIYINNEKCNLDLAKSKALDEHKTLLKCSCGNEEELKDFRLKKFIIVHYTGVQAIDIVCKFCEKAITLDVSK